MDYTKNTATLGFLKTASANIKNAFYANINEGLALVEAGFNKYTSSPLDFINLESMGTPKNFRTELENINFIQECNLVIESKEDENAAFTVGNCEPQDLVELLFMLNTFHIYELASDNMEEKEISSRGRAPLKPEEVSSAKIDGGEYVARAAFLETLSATGNLTAFFDFVRAFNRISHLELSSLEWEAILVNLDFFDTNNLFENIMQEVETAHQSGIPDAFAEIGVERQQPKPFNMQELVQHDSFVAFATYAGVTSNIIDFNPLQEIYTAVEDSYKNMLDEASGGVYDFEKDINDAYNENSVDSEEDDDENNEGDEGNEQL